MSIIRYVLKHNGYSLYSKYYSFKKENNMIKTKKYKIENLQGKTKNEMENLGLWEKE